MAQQEHTCAVHKIPVRADIEVEVAAHAAACVDADRAVKSFRHMPCVFKGVPADFQKFAVLRIHDRSLFGAQAEKLGMEICKPIQIGSIGNIVRLRAHGRINARSLKRVIGQRPDRGHPVTQHLPIGVNAGRTGQLRCHADDRNIAGRYILGRLNVRHRAAHTRILGLGLITIG